MAFPNDIHVTNGIPDTGTGTVATLTGLMATGLPVTSLPAITGTVTANQGGTWNVGQTGTWNIGTVTTVTAVTSITNPVAVTESGTWSVRNVGNAGGIFDGVVGAATSPANMVVAGGVYNSSPLTLTTGQSSASQFDANGYLKVNIAAGAAAGGTSSTFAAAFPTIGTAFGVKSGANMVNLNASSGGSLIILPGDGTNTATIRGASSPAAAGDSSLVVQLSPVGEVLDDAVDSGTGNKIAAKAYAGLAGQTLVSAADRIDLAGGVDRALFVRPNCGLEDLVAGVTSAITTTTSTVVIAAPGAGVKNYVTSVCVSNTSATPIEVTIQDGSGGTGKWVLPVPATSGVIQNFQPPLGGFTANNGVFAACSAGVTGIKVSANGFKSKV